MARLFRERYTARNGNGDRLSKPTRKWYAEYRDLHGRPRKIALCSDKQASRQALDTLVDALTKIRAGVAVNPNDVPTMIRKRFLEDLKSADNRAGLFHERQRPIGEHVKEYEIHLSSKQVSQHHERETIRRLNAIIADCRFGTLADLAPTPVERSLTRLKDMGLGARTRNTYLESIRAFCNWCLRTGRLESDPLVILRPVNAATDVRRQRRALTEAELQRLLDVASNRPVQDALRIRRGPRKGQADAKLKSENRERLERIGRETALVYKTLVLTGLRKGELTALRWSDLDLDGEFAWVKVRAETAKNRKSESVPIRNDLADDLRAWRDECKPPTHTSSVFCIPKNLVRVLKKDLNAAGIPQRDELDRVIDVHALRHTTATLMANAGVPPRIAQAIMRHSDIQLTTKVYTDPRQLDQRKAVDALPAFELGGPHERSSGVNGRLTTPSGGGKNPPKPESLAPGKLRRNSPENSSSFSPFCSSVGDSSQGMSKSPCGTDNGNRSNEEHSVSAVRTATYDRPRRRKSSPDRKYPQGDSNPCLQDENLISWA
ncbi:MAG: site-specific integrase, partial [Planctomycetota bacterium]